MSVGPVSGPIDTAVVQQTPLPPSSTPSDGDAATGPTAIEQPAQSTPAPIDINLPPPIDTSA